MTAHPDASETAAPDQEPKRSQGVVEAIHDHRRGPARPAVRCCVPECLTGRGAEPDPARHGAARPEPAPRSAGGPSQLPHRAHLDPGDRGAGRPYRSTTTSKELSMNPTTHETRPAPPSAWPPSRKTSRSALRLLWVALALFAMVAATGMAVVAGVLHYVDDQKRDGDYLTTDSAG